MPLKNVGLFIYLASGVAAMAWIESSPHPTQSTSSSLLTLWAIVLYSLVALFWTMLAIDAAEEPRREAERREDELYFQSLTPQTLDDPININLIRRGGRRRRAVNDRLQLHFQSLGIEDFSPIPNMLFWDYAKQVVQEVNKINAVLREDDIQDAEDVRLPYIFGGKDPSFSQWLTPILEKQSAQIKSLKSSKHTPV